MINGTQLYSEVLTQEPADTTILALHGLMGSHEYLRPLAAELNGDAEVVAVDLPGFGESPKPPESAYTPGDHAAALALTVGSLALAEVEAPLTVAGHSLGAVVGLRFAAENPELVERLFVIGMPMHHTTLAEGYRTLRNATKTNWYMATKPGGQLMHHVLFERTAMARRYAAKRYGEAIADDTVKHTFQSFARSLMSIIQRPGCVLEDLQAALESGVHVTAMYGDKDKWVNPAGRAQLDMLQGQGLRVFSMAGGHHLPVTHPKRVAEIIRSTNDRD
jgi:cis-3-alkyl-4-acyloxetan-2-one decarboxylase